MGLCFNPGPVFRPEVLGGRVQKVYVGMCVSPISERLEVIEVGQVGDSDCFDKRR